jgi:hypothetical protein
MILITCSLVYYTRCDFLLLQNAKISMRARIKMVTCFVTSVILKVLKIGDQGNNYYKIYDSSD